MKKFIHILAILLMFLFSSLVVNAQKDTGPGDPPGTPGTGDQPIGGGAGGGAPLGGGTITLLIMGALYGGNKLYHFYKENKNELED